MKNRHQVTIPDALLLNYRGIVGANTNEVQETNILYTARIEVWIGGIVAKVMVVQGSKL